MIYKSTMTFETFIKIAESSPLTWEIVGYANELQSEGVDASDAYEASLEHYGLL